MRFERLFTTPETPDSARVKIASYLQQAGYDPTGTGLVLTFQRGSAWGSTTGSSPQSVKSTIAVEVRTGYDQQTWVCAIAVVNLGAFARKDPAFWQQEMDALVASTGGTPIDIMLASTAAPVFSVRQASLGTGALDDRRVRAGANWFFWIAGMSVVNTIASRLGIQITFLIGLSGTAFVEGFGIGMARALPNLTTLVMFLALVVEILVAGIFVVLGLLARKALRWVFILGLIFYALDGIIWLAFGDYLPAIFHLVGLFSIFSGLRALGQQKKSGPA